MPLKPNNLFALYAEYQIDPQIYPVPDLQLYNTIQESAYPSLQLTTIQNSLFSAQQGNSNRRSRQWKRNRSRKMNNNKQSETNNFHHRNMITVRRISCQDMLDAQMIMKKRFEYEQTNLKNNKIRNKWNKKTRSTPWLENKSPQYTSFPIRINSSPPLVELHRSTMSRLSTSSSITNKQELEKKMSNSMNMIGLKVTSLRDSSASSLVSTQLLAATYNQTKPDGAINTTTDSQIDFGSFVDNLPHLSTTTSSIVPHFSSTIASHVPLHGSSSATVIPNILKTKSIVVPTVVNENIQDLVDQLKTCIATLSLLLQNKTKHDKYIIPNGKSYLDGRRSTAKNKQSQPLLSSTSPLASTPSRLSFSRRSISNENNLVFEDITVKKCNPSSDQHKELKRCLLVYYPDRSKNINSNGLQRHSSCSWNHLALNKHVSSSRSIQSISDNKKDDSKSTLILAEEDDEYESLNELLTNIISLK